MTREKFISRFSDLIKGTVSGFDRIVFKGLIRPLMSSSEVMSFCRSRKILNKDYKEWMMEQTSSLIERAENYSKETCGNGIERISSCQIRKEELAHQRQKSVGIKEGLIGI